VIGVTRFTRLSII